MSTNKNFHSKSSMPAKDDQTLSERALQQREEYLNTIIEQAPIGIVTVSIDGQLIKVNSAYCKITGYSKEELVSMNYKKLTYPEDLAIDAANVQQLLDGANQSYRLDKRYIRKDNKIIWVQVTRSIVRDVATGSPSYFIAQVEEITERKQMEKSIQEGEERFRNIMDNAPVGMATVAINGQFIQVNQALCIITGYSEKELENLTYQDITYREDLPANIVKVQELLEGKITHYRMEKRYVRKDGRIIWVQVTRSLLRDQIIGTPLYFIAQVEDISERKSDEEKLQRSAQEIADLYENAPCGYHSLDANDYFIRMNATELQWLGYMREEVIGKMKFTDLLTPESSMIFQENAKIFNNQGFLNDIEVEMRRKDGSIFTVLLNATGNRTSGGRYVMNRSTIFNITDRKRTEKALQESEALFRTIMDNAPIGMAMQSLEGKFLKVNRALCEITGYKKEELEKMNFKDITYRDDLATDIANIRKLIEGKERYYHIEKRHVRKDGTISWIELTRSILRDTLTGEPKYFIIQIEDINERIRAKNKIHNLAYHDILTGLFNRQYLLERLQETLASAQRHARSFAIMFVDLDKFKRINDTLGHDVGDALLKEIGIRLSHSSRKDDIVARTGGDEFIIVLTEISLPHDAAIAAEKILMIINQPITINKQQLQITASIGIAIYPQNGRDITELMKSADKAMYKAKDSGGNQYYSSNSSI